MTTLVVRGLPDHITHEVRATLRSPEYGHPAVLEVARGTGPCRACLRLFRVGEERRILFTYRPSPRAGSLGAPGPVFIHAEPCVRYDAERFPDELRELPLVLEGHASGNRVLRARAATGLEVGAVLDSLMADRAIEFVDVRHGEAGCHITRIERPIERTPAP